MLSSSYHLFEDQSFMIISYEIFIQQFYATQVLGTRIYFLRPA
ncbi:unnamed protein product [Moneuplotes crassus]|uniref:Uncharacterized protein n=1 Tax=Euplotes crassus TaxID=5936 RepID=A0AAD1Y9J8_EUPCR|nr:unnamed protein product [Moneuplotes crassus]